MLKRYAFIIDYTVVAVGNCDIATMESDITIPENVHVMRLLQDSESDPIIGATYNALEDKFE